jgi:hypothetical protein
LKQYITNPEQSKPLEGDEPPATYLHPIKLLTYLAKSPDLSPTLEDDELLDEELLEDELDEDELLEDGAFVVVRLAFT